MNHATTAARTYEELLAACTNPRQRTSLERMKAACDYLESVGSKISLSAIEAYCADRKWDGPKAQSIRNSAHVLKRYADLRKSMLSAKSGKKPKGSPSAPIIADESLRAYVRVLTEERDQAINAKNRIEAGLRQIPGISVDALIRNNLGKGVAHPGDTPPLVTQSLSQDARAALRSLFSDERLKSCGLEQYRDRIRHRTTHNVLLEKAEVEALRSLLS